MPKYMLLLHDPVDGFAAMSPEQMQQVIEKYVRWGDGLKAAGVLRDGQKLADEPGRVMRARGGAVRITDGPYSETKEVLGGYYTIETDSYERAVDLARDCPHLEYGGTIEVRRIEDVPQ